MLTHFLCFSPSGECLPSSQYSTPNSEEDERMSKKDEKDDWAEWEEQPDLEYWSGAQGINLEGKLQFWVKWRSPSFNGIITIVNV